MPDLAVHHVRHRLEAAVRMIGSALGLARRVLDGAHVVQQQERVRQAEVDAGGRATDLEPLAFEEPRCVDHARRPAGSAGPPPDRRAAASVVSAGVRAGIARSSSCGRRTARAPRDIPVTGCCPTTRGPCAPPPIKPEIDHEAETDHERLPRP